MSSTPDPAHRLTLIGTVHRDRNGEPRLVAALQRLAPTLVTLELSSTSLSYRQQHGGLLRQRLERILERLAAGNAAEYARIENHPTVIDIRQLLDLPFEYRAAAAYGAQRGVMPALIDLPQVAEQKLRRVETELITLRNLRTLVGLPGQVPEQERYTDAAALVERSSSPALRRAFLVGRRGDEGIGPRDRQMAAEIRRRMASPEATLVHIGGWVHLVDDPDGETLYSLLADLQPHRLLLGDG